MPQLKKGLNFNMQKITSQSKLYIDCNDCGMAQYMYFDYKITFTPLNFLKPRTLIPSKPCIVFFANRKKKIFPQNTIETRK